MRITQKRSGRRPRIQFYLTEELAMLVSKNRVLAKKFNLRLDFQDAFREWFLKECLEANTLLKEQTKGKKDNGDAQAA